MCVQCTSCSIISRPRGAIPHHTAGLTQTPTKQQQEQQQQQHNIYRPIPITQTFISSNVKCNTSKTCTHCLACRACHICLLVLPPSIFPAFCIQFSQNIPVPFAALSLSYLLVSHPHTPSIYPRATFHSLVLTLRLSPSVLLDKMVRFGLGVLLFVSTATDLNYVLLHASLTSRHSSSSVRRFLSVCVSCSCAICHPIAWPCRLNIFPISTDRSMPYNHSTHLEPTPLLCQRSTVGIETICSVLFLEQLFQWHSAPMIYSHHTTSTHKTSHRIVFFISSSFACLFSTAANMRKAIFGFVQQQRNNEREKNK